MDESLAEKPKYGNWVPKKFIYIPGAISLLFWVLSFALTAFVIVAVVFLLVALYFAYARYRFSPAGGDVQTQIQELVLHNLDGDGKGKGWILNVATVRSRSSWYKNMLKPGLLESIIGANSGNTRRVFANEMLRLREWQSEWSFKRPALARRVGLCITCRAG